MNRLADVLLGLMREAFRALRGGPCCRHWPSCGEYARSALRAHGLWRGGWLGLRRLLKCHPGTPGGWDPVPPPESNRPRPDL